MDKVQQREFRDLWHLIGNSPLLAIVLKYKNELRTIYAKSEQYNITGSIKDRMALYIIQEGYQANVLKPKQPIIEATSGNTGISFAAIGRALGHPVTILMPDWLSVERGQIIKGYGAEVVTVSREEGGFAGSIRKTEVIAKERGGAFLPKQFENEANVMAHYLTTAPELWWQLQHQDITPDAFVAGVGTGGTIMGVGRFLKEKSLSIKVNPMEPAESPTLKTGYQIGKHRIQGISDEFIPKILQLEELDDIIDVSDGDSIIMAQLLASQLGLAVGISSGANLLAALKVQSSMHKGAIMVTVFPDDNKKYLSTDLMKAEPYREGFLTPDIELLEYRVFKRACITCCAAYPCRKMVKCFEPVS